jgi:hypothetical protein
VLWVLLAGLCRGAGKGKGKGKGGGVRWGRGGLWEGGGKDGDNVRAIYSVLWVLLGRITACSTAGGRETGKGDQLG